MNRAPIPRGVALAIAVLIGAAIVASSCSQKLRKTALPNLLPEVRITSAPIDTNVVCDPSPTRSCYLITVNWVGYDPDGRVDHYLYAVDPPSGANADTVWKTTQQNEVRETFTADAPVNPRPGSDRRIAEAPHVFVIKAVDNQGASGPYVYRAFFSFTEAPTVQINDPSPSPLLTPLFPPSVRIVWSGRDADGVFHTKPIRYKYILLGPSSVFSVAAATTDPDSLRNFYAPDFNGWESVSGDTTEVQFTNLVPNQTYMFVVVGFDEAGAYSPVFSLSTNMFRFKVGFAGQNGPKITLFNEFFDYTYRFGGYCPCPGAEVQIEVPANIRLTFNWSADPPPGANIRSYRWSLDNPDVSNEDPRDDETRDLSHWSTRSLNITSAQVGPFAGGTAHRLYVEAEDNNGLRSLGIVNFLPVQSSLERKLLIVDDTRLKGDGLLAGQTCVQAPKGPWPTAAELDTFLYARGNVPWRCYPSGINSTPGLFADYGPVGSIDVPSPSGIDTVGTRIGRQDLTVRLSRLGLYQRVLWLTDGVGANNYKQGTDPQAPQTALRYMTESGHFNSLAAYVKQGGKVWVAGGGGGFAANINWNDGTNDRPTITFAVTGRNRELGPGRFMYDVAHWRSEFRVSTEPADIRRFTGRFGDTDAADGAGSPYATLPRLLEKKTRATDPMAPNRVSTGDFYRQVTDFEYLQVENFVIQPVQAGPDSFVEVSTLDSLYWFPGNDHPVNILMTYYHGPDIPQGMVFSGFNLWYFRRTECKALVDFVLQHLWNMTPGAVSMRARTNPSAALQQPRDANGSQVWHRNPGFHGAVRYAPPEQSGAARPRR